MINRRIFATLGVAATIAAIGTLLPSATPDAKAYRIQLGRHLVGLAGQHQVRGRLSERRRRHPRSQGHLRVLRLFHLLQLVRRDRLPLRLPDRHRPRQRVPTRAAAENAARAKAGPGSHIRAYACTAPDNRVHMSDAIAALTGCGPALVCSAHVGHGKRRPRNRVLPES